MNELINSVLTPVVGFIINTINVLGYPGIGVLMAIESAAIPLPSEVIMPFSGFLVSVGRFGLFEIALAGALGSVLGSWITYGVGRYGGRPLIRRYGHYVLITEHDLDLADRFFARFGIWATFIGRVIPVIRTYISIPAGISKVRFWSFTAACFFGSYLWSLLLGWVGIKLGENWQNLRSYFREVDWLILILLVVALVWWVRRHLKNRISS